MSARALFEGLVFDEQDRPLEVTLVGGEANYVIDDDGFRRHVEAGQIDRQVLHIIREQVLSNQDAVTEGTMKMLGSDDLFTKAMVDSSLQNIDQHFDRLLATGLPEDARQWLGMLGFRIQVNYRGEVQAFDQPGMIDPNDE